MTSYTLDMKKLQAIDPDATADQLLQYLAQTMEGKAKQKMEGARHGRIYTFDGVEHQASAPGEAPAVLTGNLKNSIIAQPEGPDTWAVLVGTEYAAPLEYGTQKMAARPFMLPSFEETTQLIPSDWLEENL